MGSCAGCRPVCFRPNPVPPVGCARNSSLGEKPGCVRRANQRVNPEVPGPQTAPPTPLPQRASSSGSRPVIPTPRATPVGREAPGLCLQAHLSGGQILFRRRLRVQKHPGQGPAPPESRLLWPEGHREQWTVEARPQPLSLAAENGPWSSAFLLANTAPSPRRERGWTEGIVGVVVHPFRPPGLRA